MKMLMVCLMLLSFACSAPATRGTPDGGSVLIRGGSFTMGTRVTDIPALKTKYAADWPGVFANEAPAHEVTVQSFRIDRYEVTNAEFQLFVRAVPEWRKSRFDADEHNGQYLAAWQGDRFPPDKEQHPVVYITWAAAQSFCRWRQGRLPTEAEWEFVSRSGDPREFPWGEELPSPFRANYGASNIGETVKVGSYAPTDSGVFDLAGNVWEFLLDAWLPAYSRERQDNPIAGGPVADDQIRSIRGRRAVRGASFGGSVLNLRTRWRDSHVVTNATEFVGFRCAYPADFAQR